MHTINSSIHIQRQTAEVFDFVCDPANTPRWQPEAQSSRTTPPGPLQAGSQIENKARGAGITLRSTSTVSEFTPGEKIAFDTCSAGDRINAKLIWTAVPESSGTRFSVRADYQIKGLLKLTAPIFVPTARKTIDSHLKNLKAALETAE